MGVATDVRLQEYGRERAAGCGFLSFLILLLLVLLLSRRPPDGVAVRPAAPLTYSLTHRFPKLHTQLIEQERVDVHLLRDSLRERRIATVARVIAGS